VEGESRLTPLLRRGGLGTWIEIVMHNRRCLQQLVRSRAGNRPKINLKINIAMQSGLAYILDMKTNTTSIKPDGNGNWNVALNGKNIGTVKSSIFGCAAEGRMQQPTPGAAIADLLKANGATETQIYAATAGL